MSRDGFACLGAVNVYVAVHDTLHDSEVSSRVRGLSAHAKSASSFSVSGVSIQGEVSVAMLHVTVLHTDSASLCCDVCAAGV